MNSPGPYLDIETKTFLAWQEKFSLGQPVSARWQTFVRNQEQADGSWFDDPLRCPVAPVFRLGIYGINQMISLCGEVQSVGVAHADGVTVWNYTPIRIIAINLWYLIGGKLKYFITAFFLSETGLSQKKCNQCKSN
tara:strand:- start:106 stop:513 length:408 start_codon:yes stop_codon:yes gene_type:complete